MPSHQVRRSKLPYETLNIWQTDALREFERIRQVGLQVIERDVMNAQPDVDEQILIGTQADGAVEPADTSPRIEPLIKGLTSQQIQFEQAVRNFHRRLRYGAPLKPAFGETTANLVLLHMPTEHGSINFDSQQGKTAKLGQGKEEIVPLLAVVAIPKVNVLGLRDALTGRRSKTPVAIKHPKVDAYTLVDGAEEFLAARIVRIPALLMNVHRPRDVSPIELDTEESVDRTEVETKAIEKVLDIVYKLPSLLEPIAELARRYLREDFRSLWLARLSDEEQRVMLVAESKDQRRAAVWLRLFSTARDDGKSEAEASRIVRNNSRFKRVEDLAEAANDRKVSVLEKWETRREEFREALKESVKLAKEDGVEGDYNPENLSPSTIYMEAHKGQPVEEVDRSKGYPGGAYEIGQRVEIMTPQGEWVMGVINRVEGFDVRIKRADGQFRLVKDPTKIRQVMKLDLGQHAKLDTEAEIWYNKDMEKRIEIPKFNVTLPAGSNSLRIEREIAPSTAEMNEFALPVSEEIWRKNKDVLQRQLDHLVAEARIKADWPEFRPNASADGIKVFLEQRGLPPQRFNRKTGKPAMDKETLQAFQTMGDDLAGLVIEAREAQSKVSQMNSWEQYAVAGEVQCVWNQLGTPHGRYSCEDPNLQNRVLEIRETVEAPQGFHFLSLDLGQAEYVTWASLSQDPTLIKAFESDTDFHAEMFSEIHEAAPNLDLHGTPERKAGKTINFALLYLMQPFVLAKKLGIAEVEAREIIAAYKARAPIAIAYMERVISEFQKTGISSTKFGRVRELAEIKTAKHGHLHQLTKTLWHHHNAGTAAEILKIKQVKSWKAIRRAFSLEEARLVLQMHDEVIFMVNDENLADATEITKTAFAEPIPGFLPFKIDVRTGRNWLQISK